MIQVHPVFALIVSLIPSIILTIIGVPDKICLLVGLACIFLMFHIVGKLERGDYQAHRRGFSKSDTSKAKLCYEICKHYTATGFRTSELADEINRLVFEALQKEKVNLEYNCPPSVDLDRYALLLLMKKAEEVLVSGRYHDGDGILGWMGREIFSFWEFCCLREAIKKNYIDVIVEDEVDRLKKRIAETSWLDCWGDKHPYGKKRTNQN